LTQARQLRDRLERDLADLGDVNGAGAQRLPHVSNMSFRGFPGPELVAALDLAGVCVSSGSACSAGTSEPSPVISAMVGPARAKTAVRFSLGPTTTEAEIERTVSAVRRALA
jgi:cysteine desulfurase